MPFGLVDDALTEMFADVTRRRRAAGSYASGRFVQGAESTATIRASVQPMPSDEAQDLPDAVRSRGVVKAYSVSAFLSVDERTVQVGDRVDWNNEQWEVMTVDRWQVGGLDHYKAICARQERA